MQNYSLQPDVPNPRAQAPIIVGNNVEVRSYAEIGVLFGETACRVAEAMRPEGHIYLFDFQDMFPRVKKRLSDRGCLSKHIYHFHGVTRKVKDSYNWELLRLIREATEAGRSPALFDYVFLDGAHTYDVDGLAFFLVDLLLKPGGYIEFDDYNWTLARSPTVAPDVFPQTAEWYTEEQIAVPHMKLIVDALVEGGGSYNTVEKGRLYRKRHPHDTRPT